MNEKYLELNKKIREDLEIIFDDYFIDIHTQIALSDLSINSIQNLLDELENDKKRCIRYIVKYILGRICNETD